MTTETQIIDALVAVGCADESVIVSLCRSKDILDNMLEENNVQNHNLWYAHLIGQTAHESGGYKHKEENLNYSAERLCQVWPHRFPTIEKAHIYGRNPEVLANYVYRDRLGNDEDGDGYKYRGRGWIQITGKYNYKKAGDYLGVNLVDDPNLAIHQDMAWCIAGWCMSTKKYHGVSILDYIEKEDYLSVTMCINGASRGLKERTEYTQRSKKAIGAEL